MSSRSSPSPFAAQLQSLLAKLDKELANIPLLIQVERKTKVPKTYAVAGIALVLTVLIFFNIWGQLLTNLLGFLYPAYASFKALESTRKEDDVQWLTYWTVFGFVNIIEFFSNIVLYWIPLYYTMKAIFIIWLVLPQFKGAEILYKQVIRPILLAESKGIDKFASKIQDQIKEATAGLTEGLKKAE